MRPTDELLLRRWREGDERAGGQLVRRHLTTVLRFLRRRVGTDAEDLAQKTFEAALMQSDRFRAGGSVRAWLLGIARNKMLMHLRQERRHASRFVASEEDRPGDGLSPSGGAAAKQEHKVLLRAMRSLPVDLQLALELFYWEGMSNADIAMVLGTPRSTVTSRIWRARERLREAVRNMDINEALRLSTLGNFESWARSLRELLEA